MQTHPGAIVVVEKKADYFTSYCHNCARIQSLTPETVVGYPTDMHVTRCSSFGKTIGKFTALSELQLSIRRITAYPMDTLSLATCFVAWPGMRYV